VGGLFDNFFNGIPDLLAGALVQSVVDLVTYLGCGSFVILAAHGSEGKAGRGKSEGEDADGFHVGLLFGLVI
jgi:hypothetical protein